MTLWSRDCQSEFVGSSNFHWEHLLNLLLLRMRFLLLAFVPIRNLLYTDICLRLFICRNLSWCFSLNNFLCFNIVDLCGWFHHIFKDRIQDCTKARFLQHWGFSDDLSKLFHRCLLARMLIYLYNWQIRMSTASYFKLKLPEQDLCHPMFHRDFFLIRSIPSSLSS